MADFVLDSDSGPSRQASVARIATSLFIGVPLTIGLVVALSAYCTFQLAASLVRTKPKPVI